MNAERIDVLAVIDSASDAALADLIDAAARHVHAIDHPVNDGDDAARQARTLRALSAALARVQGGAA